MHYQKDTVGLVLLGGSTWVFLQTLVMFKSFFYPAIDLSSEIKAKIFK